MLSSSYSSALQSVPSFLEADLAFLDDCLLNDAFDAITDCIARDAGGASVGATPLMADLKISSPAVHSSASQTQGAFEPTYHSFPYASTPLNSSSSSPSTASINTNTMPGSSAMSPSLVSDMANPLGLLDFEDGLFPGNDPLSLSESTEDWSSTLLHDLPQQMESDFQSERVAPEVKQFLTLTGDEYARMTPSPHSPCSSLYSSSVPCMSPFPRSLKPVTLCPSSGMNTAMTGLSSEVVSSSPVITPSSSSSTLVARQPSFLNIPKQSSYAHVSPSPYGTSCHAPGLSPFTRDMLARQSYGSPSMYDSQGGAFSDYPSSPALSEVYYPSSPSLSSSGLHELSKKERNRLAAERCRRRKQDLIEKLSKENQDLRKQNNLLIRAFGNMKRQVDLLTSLCKSHGITMM